MLSVVTVVESGSIDDVSGFGLNRLMISFAASLIFHAMFLCASSIAGFDCSGGTLSDSSIRWNYKKRKEEDLMRNFQL